MTKLTVTLTRAHKISERIASKMGELKSSIASRETTVRLTAAPTAEQSAHIRAVASQAETDAETYCALALAQAAIRKAIGNANVSAGVSDLLATVEGNKKLISFYETLISSQTPAADSVHIDSLAGYAWPQGTAYGAGVVSVTARNRTEIARWAELQEALERENFSLNDKLADLNAKMVDIDVAEELRAGLGL